MWTWTAKEAGGLQLYLVFSRGLAVQVVSEGVSKAGTVQTRSSGRWFTKALRQEHAYFGHDKKRRLVWMEWDHRREYQEVVKSSPCHDPALVTDSIKSSHQYQRLRKALSLAKIYMWVFVWFELNAHVYSWILWLCGRTLASDWAFRSKESGLVETYWRSRA